MNNFKLHPQLEKDCITLGNLPLCRLLLMNDTHYPWCILVPQRDNKTEIHQLDDNDQQQLWLESRLLSEFMLHQFQGDKMNIAALGNVVSQLHIHHIVRFHDDAAWPKPVWGVHTAVAYEQPQAQQLQEIFIPFLQQFS